MSGLESWLGSAPTVQAGFVGSLIAGLATGVGAIPIFFRREWPRSSEILMLSAAAGIMLAATAFSLILPGIDVVVGRTGSATQASLVVGTGILLGALAIWGIHTGLPHEHFIIGREGALSTSLGRHWLFVAAITLHNVPEGMSVGVSYGLGDVATALAVTTGIGLQNMPEGLAVAAALVSEGYGQGRAFMIALATGLVEPVGGLVGAGAVSMSDALLPWGLAFAAGAMLFVISHEIIPETHREGPADRATLTLVLGFVVMMVLDVALG
jgi:ZIP family zinc transporter